MRSAVIVGWGSAWRHCSFRPRPRRPARTGSGRVTDPAGGPPPPYVPPRSGIGSVLAQSEAAPAGPLGLPDLSSYTPGCCWARTRCPRHPERRSPSRPGSGGPSTAPTCCRRTSPRPAPGHGVQAEGIARHRRIRAPAGWRSCGGCTPCTPTVIWRVPCWARCPKQLGQPLPGTAPAPGIYLPTGTRAELAGPGSTRSRAEAARGVKGSSTAKFWC